MPNLQYMIDRLPVGVVILDRDRHVTGYSGVAAEVFGADRIREYLGMPIGEMHPEQSRAKIDWLLTSSDEDDASDYASMLINVPETMLQLRIMRLSDADGPTGYCLMLYDITELASRPTDEDDTEGSGGRCLAKLPVSTKGHIGLLDVGKVTFIRAKGHYTQVCTLDACYFCNLAIGQLAARLPQQKFIRVHRSYLVNLDYACKVQKEDDAFILCIQGATETAIPVSRSALPRLRELLGV